MTDGEAAELEEQAAAVAAAHARGAAEERAAVVAHLTEGADLAGPGDARRVLLAASDGIKHGEHRRDIKVEQAGPETRSWVQALTAKWPAGDPGEGHSGFCQHHLTGECAPGCRREGPPACPFCDGPLPCRCELAIAAAERREEEPERVIRTRQCGNCNGAGCPDCHFGEVEVPGPDAKEGG